MKKRGSTKVNAAAKVRTEGDKTRVRSTPRAGRNVTGRDEIGVKSGAPARKANIRR